MARTKFANLFTVGVSRQLVHITLKEQPQGSGPSEPVVVSRIVMSQADAQQLIALISRLTEEANSKGTMQ